jgi:hypothetical protein
VKRPILIGAAALALLLAAYSAGRYATPAKVVTKNRFVEVEKVVERVRVETVIQTVEVVKKDVRTVTRWEKNPDGRVIVTKTEEDKTETKNEADTATKAESVKVVEREKIVERLKIVESKRPDWLIGAQIGVKDVFAPLNGTIYGATIDRRIIGSAYLGVWANTSGAVGVGLRLEF